MADNVTIPATGSGSATPAVATDDVGGVHYQRVKIDGGADGAAAPIVGDTANGLDVDVTRLPSGTVAGGSSLPAGTNNIGDVDVLTLPVLPAGDNNIGNVDIVTIPSITVGSALPAGTNNIGDVDVLTLPALPAGANNIGDVDVLTLPTLPAGDNNIGNVDIVTMPSVTVGTSANLTESLVDDAAFTPGTSRVLPVGFEFDDTLPDSVNEGDIGAARMSANRNIYTTLRDAAGNERGANVNASSQLEVNVGAALPAGTNNIGDVDVLSLPAIPAGTNNIGDVDILTIAAGDNNIGNVDLASAIPAGTNNIGDVDVLTLPAVTNAGTFAVQESGGALTALQLLDDTVYTDGIGTPSKALGVAGTDGTNPQIIKTDAAGELQVDVLTLPNVTIGAAIPAGANNIGDVDIASIAAGDNNIGNVDIVTMPNVTIGAALPAGANNIGDVDILSIAAGDNNIGNVDLASAIPAGTNNIGDVDVLTLPGVAGDVAHDGADSGNPVKVGHKAIAHGANPTAVAANDRTDGYANRHGIPFVIGGHPNIITLEAEYTAAQTNTAIVTVAGGLKIVVTQVQALCDNANTVDVGLRVGFAAATTPTTTGVVLTHPGVAPGSGVSRGDGSGILGIGADGEDLRITSEVPTTGALRILVSYYTIES